MDNENSVTNQLQNGLQEANQTVASNKTLYDTADVNKAEQPTATNNFNDDYHKDSETEAEFFRYTDELKLTREQAEKISRWANIKATDAIKKHRDNTQAKRDSTLKKLQDEWGDKHAQRLANAIKASEKISSIVPEFKEFLESTGAGNDYRMIKTIEKLSDFVNEDYITNNSRQVEGKAEYFGDIPLISFESMKK